MILSKEEQEKEKLEQQAYVMYYDDRMALEVYANNEWIKPILDFKIGAPPPRDTYTNAILDYYFAKKVLQEVNSAVLSDPYDVLMDIESKISMALAFDAKQKQNRDCLERLLSIINDMKEYLAKTRRM